MTIPAVWSDAARQKTLDAAKAAGIGPKIQTISEPEAAAVHAFATLQNKDLKIGDVYIICDAGGGTVDLITLEVTSLDPMQFREVVPGEGGLCGSAFINFGFENLMKTKFGPNEFHKFYKRSPKQWKVVMDNFDQSVKRSFDMSKARNRKRKFELPFPGMPDNSTIGIEGGMLSLTSEEIENMFEPVCRDILLLIQRQVDAATTAGHSPSGILVVGGLGRSPYLLDRINERFIGTPSTAGVKRDYDEMTGDRSSRPKSPAMTLLKPADAWTAVVRGAALGGMSNVEVVTSRKARRHYGVRYRPEFDPTKHSPSAKYWDEIKEKWKARGQMKWYIRKGDTVPANVPILNNFHRINAEEHSSVGSDLYCCDDDQAPQERRGNESKIYKLCSVDIPRRDIPGGAFRKMENSSGAKYTNLDYALGMHVGSGELRFDFRLDGRVLGHIDARFD
ncbi:hypothetical protein BDZ85DRAFT_254962 [Elsinoe ampelina]|uniref:Uncharacterized protein n=1 Tax=Elsinoe ampelina TaxID=302913 RepID=A0A6A6GQ22_9PEZI|nr:hypothetical protein BDZ85DRAFT_254962 [Elsinoe ampelina]